MVKISWDTYRAKNVFDEYLTSKNKLRPETRNISNFIAKYSKQRLLTTVKN